MNRKFITGIVVGNALILMGIAGAVLGINPKSPILTPQKEESTDEKGKRKQML